MVAGAAAAVAAFLSASVVAADLGEDRLATPPDRVVDDDKDEVEVEGRDDDGADRKEAAEEGNETGARAEFEHDARADEVSWKTSSTAPAERGEKTVEARFRDRFE